MRTLTAVLGNSQRLDGGSMFGNAPRAVWERWLKPDERHRVPLACRALLVEEESGRRILFEAGVGAFFPPKLRDRFGVLEEEHVLLASLAELGLTPGDVDVIVLSHLHFDHAGGLLTPYESSLSSRVRARLAEACAPRADADEHGAQAEERLACTPEERLERLSALWADVLGM